MQREKLVQVDDSFIGEGGALSTCEYFLITLHVALVAKRLEMSITYQ